MSPRLRVLMAGLLFSLGGVLIKSCTFPSLERAGLRAAVAALTLFVLLPEARRPRAAAWWLVLPYFGATVLFVVANTLTTAANSIFLQSTSPFWVTLLAPVVIGERARRRDLLVLACIAAGMTLFFLAPATGSATAPDPRLGDLFALASGLSYGILLLGFRRLGRSGDATDACAAVLWGNVVAAPLAFALMPVFGQQPTLGDPNSWLAIAALGSLQVGLAYALLVRAMPHVPAVAASLLLMIEPALNPVLTFAVHGETPHALAIAGGVLILGAVAAASLRTSRLRVPERSAS